MELREAQKELQKLKAASGSSERSSPEGGKGSPVDAEGDGELSEGQLIIRLKNQGRHSDIQSMHLWNVLGSAKTSATWEILSVRG